MSDSDPATISCTACSTGFGGWDGQSPCPDTGTGEHTWLTAVPRPAEEPDREALYEAVRNNPAVLQEALAQVRALWREALEREGNLASAVADVMWKATQFGTTEDGDTYAYIVPKGAMHRLIGVAQSNGAHVPVAFRNAALLPTPPAPGGGNAWENAAREAVLAARTEAGADPAPGGGGTDLRGEVERLCDEAKPHWSAAGPGVPMVTVESLRAALAARDADQGAGTCTCGGAHCPEPAPGGGGTDLRGEVETALRLLYRLHRRRGRGRPGERPRPARAHDPAR